MLPTLLAISGASLAFLVVYLSCFRQSAEEVGAMRVALALPTGVVGLLGVLRPEEFFTLRALSADQGRALEAISRYPHGEDAISNFSMSLTPSFVTYWAWGALALASVMLFNAWRSYRGAARGERIATSEFLPLAWLGLWFSLISSFPVDITQAVQGEGEFQRLITLSGQKLQSSSYFIPEGSWMYAPEQWYLIALSVIAALLSLLTHVVKPRELRRVSLTDHPLLTVVITIGALGVLFATNLVAADESFVRQGNLWVCTSLLGVTSLGRLPALQRNIVIITTLMALSGAL